MTILPNLLSVLCKILIFLIAVLFSYRVIFAILGLFLRKEFPTAKHFHRYAIVIAARNEEAVLGQLLESIQLQDYPPELLQVFVVADNCTDQTAAVAEAGGAICFQRHDAAHRTKGYALQYLFRQIQKHYGIDAFDGYLLMDADNLLKTDYISRMNDAFDSGEKIITSYRNTKNFSESWVAASYAFHWMRTSRLESRGRSLLDISTRLTGTGFLFAAELVKDGWNYTSLTEDRAFTADAVAQGYRISYQDAAEFYDEQPTALSIAMRQRIRWGKGHLQAFGEYFPKLLRQLPQETSMLRKITLYDTMMTLLPVALIHFFIALGELGLQLWLAFLLGQAMGAAGNTLVTLLLSVLTAYASQIPIAALLLFTERKKLPKLRPLQLVQYCLTWPSFALIGYISFVLALFADSSWKPIPHHSATRIRDLEHRVPVKNRLS